MRCFPNWPYSNGSQQKRSIIAEQYALFRARARVLMKSLRISPWAVLGVCIGLLIDAFILVVIYALGR